MNIITYLQTKTKADDLSIRIANVLMVLGIICGINAMVALNALREDRGEEIERRRRDDWDGLAEWDKEDDEDDSISKRKMIGRVYVAPDGRLYTSYIEDTSRNARVNDVEHDLIIANK